jgi:replicative DNA helicase
MDKQNPRYATMADLRESGQIEQDADMILLLNPKNVKDAVQGQNRVLRVEKNKEGGLSEIELEFEGHFQTFKKAPVTLDEHMGRGRCEPPWRPSADDYDYVGGF